MPEPRPERQPGETLAAYSARLEEWAKSENAPAGTPGKPSVAPIPEGWKQGPTPGNIIRLDGFAGMTLNPATGQYEADKYGPSTATLAAAGITKGGGGSTGTKSAGGTATGAASKGGGGGTNYAVQNAQNKAEVQTSAGGITTPPANWLIHPSGARAVDPSTRAIYTKDPTTSVWTTYGSLYNPRTDGFWVAQAGQAKAQAGPQPSTAISPKPNDIVLGRESPNPTDPRGRAIDPLAPTLNQNQGPTFSSGLFSQGTVSGAALPYSEGMIRGGSGVNSALNNLVVQPRTAQGNGPVVQGASTAGNGGGLTFNNAGRTVAPDRVFPAMQFYVPSTYDPRTGMSTDGNFSPVDVGYNITTPGLDPLAPSPGGAAVMTLSGPQTAHINNMSTGFNPNAMAYSNFGATYGRDFSHLDPVSQMMASAALIDEREKLFGMGYSPQAALGAMTAAAPGTWEGYGPDGGQRAFGVGGRVAAIDPLGASRPDLITNEPIVGVGLMTGKRHFILGEDNADRDRRPDREAVYFRGGNTMDIVPMERFAEGGRVSAIDPLASPVEPPVSPLTAPQPIVPVSAAPAVVAPAVAATPEPAPRYWRGPDGTVFQSQNPYIMPGYEEVGDINGNPLNPVVTPPVTQTPTPETPRQGPPIAVPIDNGGVPAPDPLEGFDPLDTSILAPWQKVSRDLSIRDAQRQDLAYRYRDAGLSGPTGIPVIEGNVPEGELPPGMFYDPSGQVNRVINDIIGMQSEFRSLGPRQDMTQIQEDVSQIGIQLDDLQRIRSLEDARVAAEAGGNVPSTDPALVQTWNDEIIHLQGVLTTQPNVYNASEIRNRISYLTSLVNGSGGTQLNSADKVAVINAQIDAIRKRLPEGVSEAGLTTQLARLREKLGQNDRRTLLMQSVKNLANAGVPSLSAPIKPIDPLAA